MATSFSGHSFAALKNRRRRRRVFGEIQQSVFPVLPLSLSLCLFSIPRLLSCSDYDDSIATTSSSLKRRANKKETASATLPFATVRKTSEDCHPKVPTTLETIQLIHPRTVLLFLSLPLCVYCTVAYLFFQDRELCSKTQQKHDVGADIDAAGRRRCSCTRRDCRNRTPTRGQVVCHLNGATG